MITITIVIVIMTFSKTIHQIKSERLKVEPQLANVGAAFANLETATRSEGNPAEEKNQRLSS